MESKNKLTKDQQELVEKHIELAMNLGNKFRGRGVSVEELQQEACLGLCEAAMRYEGLGASESGISGTRESDGSVASFRTYAYSWCMKYILLAIRHDGDSLTVAEKDVEACGTDVMADDGTYQRECIFRVERMLDRLTVLERTVVCYVYGIDSLRLNGKCKMSGEPVEPKGFKEIASIMKLQVTRVKQLYQKAMVVLKGLKG